MKALIYTRISRDHSGEAQANERQEEACRMLCAMRGWEIVGVEEDVSISAYADKERPGWERVKRAMSEGRCDVVVAWKMDRMTRTVAGLVEIVQLCRSSETAIATTDGMLDLTTATGKAVATILAAVAELEVELKAERQEAANKQRRDSGIPWNAGWRAFGYAYDGAVVEEEAALVRKGYHDLLDGKSLRAIAREWNESGLLSDNAKKMNKGRGDDEKRAGWTYVGVRKVLANPRYAGWLTYEREIVGKGAWEPIVDAPLWSSVQAFLNGRVARGQRPRTLLSGILTCATCDEPMTAGITPIEKPTEERRANGKKIKAVVGYRDVYKCPKGHARVPREEIDQLVISRFAMSSLVTRPGLLLSIRKRNTSPDVSAEVAELLASLEHLAIEHRAGRMPAVAYEPAVASVNARLTELENVSNLPAENYDANRLALEAVEDFLGTSDDARRELLRVVLSAKVKPRGRGAAALSLEDQVEPIVDAGGKTFRLWGG